MDPLPVAAEFRRVLLGPLDHAAHITGARWPFRPWRQAISCVHTEDTLAGEPSSDIAVHFTIEILVAAYVCAAMDKDHDRRAGSPDWLIDVEDLPGILAIGQILRNGHSIFRRGLEQWTKRR